MSAEEKPTPAAEPEHHTNEPQAESKKDGQAQAKAEKLTPPKPAKPKSAAIQIHPVGERIHPKKAEGRFAKLRIAAVLATQFVFYIIPWFNWSDRQAVLFNIPERHFYIFGLSLGMGDLIYLALLLMICAFGLFWWTTIAGRLWCGYSCPQTVYTEIMLWIDNLVEGDRNKRLKLEKSPWNFTKIRIKATKYLLIFLFCAWTGITFAGWFNPIREFVPALFNGSAGGGAIFAAAFYGFMTFFMAHIMREKVCLHMCPYARFQSAMFDKDTMIIAYDEARGEPRGSRKRGVDYKEKGLGACIDCTMCVQVCPTGIDIRNGLQYQCISCSACIDICNDVMDKMGYAKGLIRYTTEHSLEGKEVHILRPRIFVYGGFLLFLLGLLIYAVGIRNPIQLDVIRDRASLYRETPQGLIENVYVIKAINKDSVPHTFELTASGIEGLKVVLDREIVVDAGSVLDVPMSLVVNPNYLTSRATTISFKLTATDNPELSNEEEARFLGPDYR